MLSLGCICQELRPNLVRTISANFLPQIPCPLLLNGSTALVWSYTTDNDIDGLQEEKIA